jgi:hypothetical protein
VLRADKGEYMNLNKSAGGEVIYMILFHETSEGHNKSRSVSETRKEATCGADGLLTEVYYCDVCFDYVTYETVLPATGEHVDEQWDDNHRCDVCRRNNASECTAGWVEIMEIVNPTPEKAGYVRERVYCSECEEFMYIETTPLEEAGLNGTDVVGVRRKIYNSDLTTSLIGNGSIIAICVFASIAVIAGTIIYLKKKKEKTKKQ